MPAEALVVMFAIATGYVAAGLVSSLYSLLTNRPASFRVVSEGLAERLLLVPLIVFGGPFILSRNAVRGRVIENRPIGWLCVSLTIVLSWSFISGLFVIHLALSI